MLALMALSGLFAVKAVKAKIMRQQSLYSSSTTQPIKRACYVTFVIFTPCCCLTLFRPYLILALSSPVENLPS